MQVVFVAYGLDYLAMALNAGMTLKSTNPTVSSVCITNIAGVESLLHETFDVVVVKDEPDSNNRMTKLRAIDYATDTAVAYLDADVEVLGDLRPAFAMLETFDVLLHAFRVPTKFDFALSPDLAGADVAQFWGAVIFFRRNGRSESLFDAWERRFRESGIRRDQPALQRAVLDCPDVRVLPLNMVWGATDEEIARHSDLLRRRAAARLNHYGSPERDRNVLVRVGAAHDRLVAALPDEQRQLPDVQEAVLRYRRLRHPGMRWRMVRPFLRLAWRARASIGGPTAALHGKRDAAAGEGHIGGRTLFASEQVD